MGDQKTTGTQQQANPSSQVGTHGNAKAGERMDQRTGKQQDQRSNQGAEWSDQQPGYAGGTKDEQMVPGGTTSRPESGGTTPVEHQGRPKA